ncbi:MAG: hypothetical protein M1587_02320 [Thaumarchaeota archaeon]|nr:hypothetical protein [Nitrososphaerota archaeon]
MKPSKEIIDRFKELMFQEFNEKLTDDSAYEKFDRLDSVLRVVFKIPLDKAKEGDILGPQS